MNTIGGSNRQRQHGNEIAPLLEQVVSGNTLGALGELQEHVERQFRAHNSQHTAEFGELFSHVLDQLVQLGLNALGANLIPKAEQILEAARELTALDNGYEEFPHNRVKVLNTLSCLYRRMNQFELGVETLEEALELQKRFRLRDQLGATYLNLCAIHSQNQNHELALSNIELALEIFESRLGEAANEQQVLELKKYIAISNFNLGVENEFLGNFPQSLNFYALSIATLDESHQSHLPFYQKFVDCREKLLKVPTRPRFRYSRRVPGGYFETELRRQGLRSPILGEFLIDILPQSENLSTPHPRFQLIS